ncbi:Uncharacterised protein [Mycobacteroides abscessus subsp. abscessus]|nr:Uncharacterised protein [Mycobacteroides abscessus subsp. abscessus]
MSKPLAHRQFGWERPAAPSAHTGPPMTDQPKGPLALGSPSHPAPRDQQPRPAHKPDPVNCDPESGDHRLGRKSRLRRPNTIFLDIAISRYLD